MDKHPRKPAGAAAAGATRAKEAAAATPAPDPAELAELAQTLFSQGRGWLPEQGRQETGPRRSADGPPSGWDPALLEAPDQVLSVRFEDGFEWHTDAPRLLAHIGPAAARRGAAGDRLLLPARWSVPDTLRRSGTEAQLAVDRYTLNRLVPPTALDRLFLGAQSVLQTWARWTGSAPDAASAAPQALKLCTAFETAELHPALGGRGGLLLRLDLDGPPGPADAPHGGLSPLGAPLSLDADRPRLLLLLHGTASSTAGGFGVLWRGQSEGAGDEDPRRELRRLVQLRGYGAVLGFDHRTLSLSPVDNVQALCQALGEAGLPPGTVIDVVSHSRGGLVGELFALRSLLAPGADRAGLQALRAIAQDCYGPAGGPVHPDRDLLDRLLDPEAGEALQQAACWPSGRFVRVACPTRGTLLADGRLDLFLSLLHYAARTLAKAGVGSLAGPVMGRLAEQAVDRLGSLARALVAVRADPQTLPGLEAMIPGAPLNRALARCGLAGAASAVDDDLRVIAGDAAPGLRWDLGVLTLLADVFAGLHDHDYVVHTRAMFGGLRRRRSPLSLRQEDKHLHHSNYFHPGRSTRRALLATLAGDDAAFRPAGQDEARTRGGSDRRGLMQQIGRPEHARRSIWLDESQGRTLIEGWLHRDRHRPVLVLLPGIMGSELSALAPDDVLRTRPPGGAEEAAEQARADGARRWLSARAMLGGQLRQLQLQDHPAGMLAPTGLLPYTYERLMAAADARYHVVGLPYDWRLSTVDGGQRLARMLALLRELYAEPCKRPVHLYAHSMGGLLARQALYGGQTDQPASWGRASADWSRLRQLGSRLLMVGTPNLGAYAPVQLLLGEHAFLNVLAGFSAGLDRADLARYGGAYPGLMEMLPSEPDPWVGDLLDPATWSTLARQDSRIASPDPAVLREAARHVRQRARSTWEAVQADPQALYLAGCGPTPLALVPLDTRPTGGMGPGRAAGLGLRSATEGDGTVAWRSALPGRSWYLDAAHDALPDTEAGFAASFELLDTGHSLRLPQQPPARRSAAAAADLPMRLQRAAPRPASLPDDDAALAEAFFGPRDPAPARARPAPVTLRVVHGGLDFARFPLLVGHYQGDALAGATQRVDEKLGGQLSDLLALRLFTGVARTAVYLRPTQPDGQAPAYPGAVVLGLGSVAELNPASLAESVSRGVLRYAFDHLHQDAFARRGSPGDAPLALRLSTLLIGTHVQAVTPRDSLSSVLYGIWRAAEILQQDGVGGRAVAVVEVEIIEIESAVAHDVAYELQRLLARPEWQERYQWQPALLTSRDGAMHGYRPRSDASLWQRLKIDARPEGGLAFALIGDRARVESTQNRADLAALRPLIDRLSDDRAQADDPLTGPQDPALGGVLYRLLLPQNLKARLANLDQTVLVVDDQSAAYPWELLSPPVEVLADGDTPRPLALHAGLLRQRVTEDFRSLPPNLSTQDVLLIGNPGTTGWQDERGAPLPFTPLPGAAAEVEAVARELQAARWPTPPVLKTGPGVDHATVQISLLERPWRIVHLAGHGVVDQWLGHRRAAPGEDEDADAAPGRLRPARRGTGLVLSGQRLLDADFVEQLGHVPELVFINACYSGRDGEGAGSPVETRRGRPRLAASLALKFIRLGARAVVAAGWQVDDDAAQAFASQFYRSLLGGEGGGAPQPFGEAVRQARQVVHARFGRHSNTWGAYQCYGDPHWSLRAAPADRERGTQRLRQAEHCMSAGELATRIAEVRAIAGDKDPQVLVRQLDGLVDALQNDPQRRPWLQDSAVRHALGSAYRELEAHRPASQWLQQAARSPRSALPLGDLEALINAMVRSGEDPAIDAATRLLQAFDDLARDPALTWPLAARSAPPDGAQAERDALRGSIALRRCHTLLDALQADAPAPDAAAPAVQAALDAAGWFAEAHRQQSPAPRPPAATPPGEAACPAQQRAYTLSNALLAAAAARLLGTRQAKVLRALAHVSVRAARPTAGWIRHPRWIERAHGLLGELGVPSAAEQLGAPTQDAAPPSAPPPADEGLSFWHYTCAIELRLACDLFDLLMDPRPATDPDDVGRARLQQEQRLREGLDRALVRWPSPREEASLRHRFQLLRAVASRAEPRALQGIGPWLVRLMDQALQRLDQARGPRR